ncbi:MAG TPA: DUF3631 domain-containing protein [Candidatus Angelobacter sp.]|nr:DUF3631 domain-containing protein [Candidatus Angelobacter sp.]
MKTDQTAQSLINQLTDFYRQYLSCSSEQLDLLALWTLHSYSFTEAPFSPSLNIHSREKHSGKTVCLQLLSLLCEHSWMHTAAAPALLLRQLTNDEPNDFRGTLLLDDCHATFGASRMNVKLQGLLTARFQHDARYTIEFKDQDGQRDFNEIPVYFPMAFAGQGRMHPCLAERSIPIALEPKPLGAPCQPFRFFAAQQLARPLAERLRQWGATTVELFANIVPYKEDQFPAQLSWRQRDCAEPLLHIADLIGGQWPQRARQALVHVFALAAFEDFYSSKQILSDIRDVFAAKANLDWISTADLLVHLHTLDDRRWDEWNKGKPMVPKNLAGLLEPFGIHPKNNRTGLDNDKVIKGYYLEDLQPSWHRHLPPRSDVAANLQNQQAASSGNVRPDAVLRCQPKEANRHQPEAFVAANLQNSAADSAPHKLPAGSDRSAAAAQSNSA